MATSSQPGDGNTAVGSKPNRKTTRRGMIAAGAAFAAALATRKAEAFDLPPRDPGRGPSCLLRGTRVRTPKGEIEVEKLAIGDLVETVDGTAKPIRWIGSWRLQRGRNEKWPAHVLPVKVAQSAFGPSTPHTDLFLSPWHCVYVDGLLIPVRTLVNGRSIVECDSLAADTIEYFHVELDSHDVFFTEGLPTETLLAANRHKFDNWLAADQADESPTGQAEPYAPRLPGNSAAIIRSRLRSGFASLIDRRQPVDLIWERLAERAETHLV
jgi:hypothetical protein